MKGIILLLVAAVVVLYFAKVSVPYEVREAYEAPVEKGIEHRVTDTSGSSGLSLTKGAVANASVEIENTDIIPGTFSVDFNSPPCKGLLGTKTAFPYFRVIGSEPKGKRI
jgi:hypothetical protein